MSEAVEAPNIWNKPEAKHRAELGGGYIMELAAVVSLEPEYLEGLLIPRHAAKKWQLKQKRGGEETVINEWELPANVVPQTIWSLAEPYLDVDSPRELNRMRLAFLRTCPETESDAVKELAEDIWQSGEALNYMCESCAKIHVGDKTAIRAMLLSYAAVRVLNGEGLHISISGSAGTGKSHAASTAAKHLPEGAVMDARVSDKALYYHQIKEGTVLLLDDQELSEDLQELLKVASTDWSKSATYLTVNNQKAVELKLPAKCPFWVVKANLNGDEQILDRQLVIWTDESVEQLRSIQQVIFHTAANPDLKIGDADAAVCREIWNYIEPAVVTIPYAEGIGCDEHMDPRNIKILLSLIQAHALMKGPQRNHEGELVEATIEDFMEAAKIINPLLENTGGSQKLKLSSGAARVLAYLAEQETGIIPFEDIRNETTMNQSALTRALYGRQDRQTDGLLGVCPALEIVEDTFTRKGGGTVRRKAVNWSKSTYKAWIGATGMFYLDQE